MTPGNWLKISCQTHPPSWVSFHGQCSLTKQTINIGLYHALPLVYRYTGQTHSITGLKYCAAWILCGPKIEALQCKSGKMVKTIPQKKSEQLWAKLRWNNIYIYEQKRLTWTKPAVAASLSYLCRSWGSNERAACWLLKLKGFCHAETKRVPATGF